MEWSDGAELNPKQEYQRPDLVIKSLCEIAIKIINEWKTYNFLVVK